jgi:hypothetical protein
MKKMLLISVMAFVGLSASAQFNAKSSVTPQTKSRVVNMPQSQRSFQAVAPRQNLGIRFDGPSGKQLTLDLAKVKPVTRAQRALFAMQNETNVLGKGKMQNRKMVNLKPTMTLNSKASTRAKAPRKALSLAETYTGVGYDYYNKVDTQWTMTPTTATYTTDEGEEEVNVLVDVIPTPDFLAELYPDGVPVMYTVEDDSLITIAPQSLASYEDEENGTTNYITLFATNSDEEDGIIHMVIRENGKLVITNGNWIGLGEFADVEFDEELDAGEAFLGLDELVVNVGYYYRYETTIDKEYNGHGADYFESVPVDWVMQRGTVAVDDDEVHFFVDMVPLIDAFSGIYPNGIDVEYEQAGNIITVKPQVIAHIPADEENEEEYIMLSSYDSEDGSIVLTEGENGSLKTVDGESIVIGAWSTSTFDPTWESYLGAYVLIKNVKYHQPGDPAEAPTDVLFEPNELVLFAGLGYSSYTFEDNLAVMGADAPTTFRNHTMDIATNFEWSVKETDKDDVETTITSIDRELTLNTKADATYEEFLLTCYNEDAASEPFTWGFGHCPNADKTGPYYKAIHVYAGASASSFRFSDGSYATMTRQNPDGDLTFYTNWATPDKNENLSISTIYSYQGKPATPLYLTGVTLPMIEFEAQEDFNLHIKLCKCTRSATGRLTVGDIIAEGDATNENVNADYDSGIKAVEFTELYVEDEFGMSETIDYLFIEDEFVIIIEGWDNGTFSGVLGSQDIDVSILPSTWFTRTEDEEGSMRYYTVWFPQLFIGLLDATYGYLHTEDETNLIFNRDGGTSSIHIDPMLYGVDDETEEPTYLLNIESVTEDGEEVDEVPEWITFEVANEDYTTATAVSETTGKEYEYFVNGIGYDLVVTAEPLPEGVLNRTAQVVFFQAGAKLTVTITQDYDDPDGITSVVAKTPLKNRHAFNVAGQPVDKNYRGIVVKDGKKMIVK